MTKTLTWSTSSDWDNAQSESNVVHESVANSDYNDAGRVQKGYPLQNPMYSSNLTQLFPFHEDSGSTVNDHSGNGRDGSYGGGTLSEPGLLNTSSVYFGSGDEATASYTVDSTSSYTVIVWYHPYTAPADSTSNSDRRTICRAQNNEWNPGIWLTGAKVRVHCETEYRDVSVNWSDTNWHMVGQTYDGSGTCHAIHDGQKSLGTRSSYSPGTPDSMVIGNEDIDGTSYPIDGSLSYWMVFNTDLSSAEVQAVYDVVSSMGNLKTARKVT